MLKRGVGETGDLGYKVTFNWERTGVGEGKMVWVREGTSSEEER